MSRKLRNYVFEFSTLSVPERSASSWLPPCASMLYIIHTRTSSPHSRDRAD